MTVQSGDFVVSPDGRTCVKLVPAAVSGDLIIPCRTSDGGLVAMAGVSITKTGQHGLGGMLSDGHKTALRTSDDVETGSIHLVTPATLAVVWSRPANGVGHCLYPAFDGGVLYGSTLEVGKYSASGVLQWTDDGNITGVASNASYDFASTGSITRYSVAGPPGTVIYSDYMPTHLVSDGSDLYFHGLDDDGDYYATRISESGAEVFRTLSAPGSSTFESVAAATTSHCWGFNGTINFGSVWRRDDEGVLNSTWISTGAGGLRRYCPVAMTRGDDGYLYWSGFSCGLDFGNNLAGLVKHDETDLSDTASLLKSWAHSAGLPPFPEVMNGIVYAGGKLFCTSARQTLEELTGQLWKFSTAGDLEAVHDFGVGINAYAVTAMPDGKIVVFTDPTT